MCYLPLYFSEPYVNIHPHCSMYKYPFGAFPDRLDSTWSNKPLGIFLRATSPNYRSHSSSTIRLDQPTTLWSDRLTIMPLIEVDLIIIIDPQTSLTIRSIGRTFTGELISSSFKFRLLERLNFRLLWDMLRSRPLIDMGYQSSDPVNPHLHRSSHL